MNVIKNITTGAAPDTVNSNIVGHYSASLNIGSKFAVATFMNSFNIAEANRRFIWRGPNTVSEYNFPSFKIYTGIIQGGGWRILILFFSGNKNFPAKLASANLRNDLLLEIAIG